eukprot:5389075-Alexandrium_andersonii.AAC.1
MPMRRLVRGGAILTRGLRYKLQLTRHLVGTAQCHLEGSFRIGLMVGAVVLVAAGTACGTAFLCQFPGCKDHPSEHTC